MSNSQPNIKVIPNSATLADILGRILGDQTMPRDRRNDIASAIRTLSRAMGRPPAEIIASAPSLRAWLNNKTGALIGLSERRFKNVISLTRFALNHTGVADWPAPHLRTLTPEWRQLIALTGDNQKRHWLSKFAGYCSAKGIASNQVSDTVVDQFYQALTATTLKRKPATVHRKICQFWNESAGNVAEWPKVILTVPDRRKIYTLPWSTFPLSFVSDLEAYLDHLAGKDILAIRDFRPLRPSSINTNRELVRQYASALIRCGHDLNELKRLSDLLPIENVKRALSYYTSRPDGSGNRQAHRYLVLLNTMAKRWVDVEPKHANELKLLLISVGKHIGSRKSGLTQKNKARLQQFDCDDDAIARLLNAPQRIIAKLPLSRSPTHDEALAAQTALAIEIFVMVPIRIGNAAGLDLERQIIRGSGGTMRLAIASQEVKNSFDIEAPLPKPTTELLDLYLRHFRPKLKNANTRWLFPGRGASRSKSTQQLRKQVQDTLAREFGLVVNPHLFRHLAALIFLRANPGHYSVVQLLLGHKSVETTIAFYCGFEASAAVRQYDQHVLLLRHDRLSSGAKAA